MIFPIKRIEKLVISEDSQKFKGQDFRALKGPGAYVIIDRKKKALYVGFGKNLLSRVSSSRHHQSPVIDESDEILLYPCVSIPAARELESLLIKSLRPPLNRISGVKRKTEG